MPEIVCISPIDGREVARRPTASALEIEAALAAARQAQRDWALVPLQERVATVMAGIAALGAMNEEVVSELAMQMGRPVRFGGEFRGVEERASHREARLRSYFLAPLSRWRVKPTVFMPTLPPEIDPARLDGLMVGLDDGKGSCMGIGVLEFDQEERVLRMVSSVSEPARGLLLGTVRITTEGQVIGRVTVRELFGPE